MLIGRPPEPEEEAFSLPGSPKWAGKKKWEEALAVPGREYMSLLCVCVRAKSLQSCQTLRDPMDCSPLGYSVCGVLQARILEWAAMPSSRASSQPRGQSKLQADSLPSEPAGKWFPNH